MRNLIFLLSIVLALTELSAQRKNYYLLLSSDQRYVELGEYVGDSYHMTGVIRTSLDSLSKKMFFKCFGLEKDTSELLVYVHCWLGNEKNFHRATLNSLNETTAENKQLNSTLSIVWESKFEGYLDSWDRAKIGGNKLSKVLRWLGERKKRTSSFFCHSMGNRLFEGMVEKLNTKGLAEKCFTEVVLAAADLNRQVFETSFRTLPHFAERIHIIVHGHDRLLLASSLLHGSGRLGRQGPVNSDSLLNNSKNIFIVDASEENPFDSFDLSNHVYFFRGRLVRNYLSEVFNHKSILDRNQNRIIYLK